MGAEAGRYFAEILGAWAATGASIINSLTNREGSSAMGLVVRGRIHGLTGTSGVATVVVSFSTVSFSGALGPDTDLALDMLGEEIDRRRNRNHPSDPGATS